MVRFLTDTQPEQLPLPTFRDTAVFRAPAFVFNSTVGRFLPAPAAEAAIEHVEDETSDSVGGDFEFLNNSTDSLKKVKASGAQQGKAKKRKGKK